MNSRAKNIVAVIGFLLVLYLSYQYAIKNTLNQRNQYKSFQKEQQLNKELPKQLSIFSNKEKYYDSLLTKHRIGESLLQNELLLAINKLTDSLELQLIDFNEPHIIEDESGMQIDSYMLIIQGSFIRILKLIYVLEQEYAFGEVTHINMEKLKRTRRRKEILQTTLILQNIN